MKTLTERIEAAIVAHPEPKARWKAMREIKWRMVCHQLGLYAALKGLDIVPALDPADAQVFDGRDNEKTKLAFYRAITGIHWEIELLNP